MLGWRLMGCVFMLSLIGFTAWTLADEDEPKRSPDRDSNVVPPEKLDRDLRDFMRLKLAASEKVLEGLALEDFTLIKEGATQLNKMSLAEKWRVSNEAVYGNFSEDFQRTTKDLTEAARVENLDRAALKWMNVTMGCIECHRYARGVMLVNGDRKLDR